MSYIQMINNKMKQIKNEYCNFMSIKTLDEFKLEFFNDNDGVMSYVNYQSNNITLFIREDLFKILKSNAEPIIYHELTHIYHTSYLLPSKSREEKNSLIRMYSEYYAVQAQMKKSLHYYKYDSIYYFNLKTKTHDWFKDRNVLDDIKYKTNDYIQKILNLLNRKPSQYVYYILLHTIYYISMCDFWNVYCKEDIDSFIVKDIPTLLFGNELELFHYFLTNKFENNEKYFNVLLDSQYKMVQYFGINEDKIIDQMRQKQ